MSKIFIPKTCRAGFQHREDTFTNQLAYVIYYDSLNKLRKETSWNGWCHLPDGNYSVWDKGERREIKGIKPFDFDNVPTSGFVLNKGVQRCNWHFGSGRSMIRIYDPRGIEFEITPENLIGLLMHTDCSKTEIQGDIVYAWCGKELMLLPCNSEQYKDACTFTQLQGKKIGARELKEGLTYVTKNEEHLVYLGRHIWYEEKNSYSEEKPVRSFAKCHIFCDMEGKNFHPIKSVPSQIAAISNEHHHDDFANWVDDYLATKESSAIVGWIKKPIDPKEWDRDWDGHSSRDFHVCVDARVDGDEVFRYIKIEKVKDHHYRGSYGRLNPIAKYPVNTLMYCDCGTVIRQDGARKSNWYERQNRTDFDYCSAEDKSIFFHLYAKFANGLELKWESY